MHSNLNSVTSFRSLDSVLCRKKILHITLREQLIVGQLTVVTEVVKKLLKFIALVIKAHHSNMLSSSSCHIVLLQIQNWISSKAFLFVCLNVL